MADVVLEVDDLSLHYLSRFGEKFHAVRDVFFTVERGQVLGIAGESGCGKSTLVSGLMGMCIPPLHVTKGDVRICGESLMNRTEEDIRQNVLAQKISMIPQGAFNTLNPVRKVKDSAADVFYAHKKPGEHLSRAEINERVEERFSQLGMETKRILNSYPIQLTAGERQRSVIGISTLLNPQIVIADEPTSALDVSTQKEVISLIFDLLDKDIFSSMIFITHELPLLYHVADNIAIMYKGEFVERGSAEQIVKNPQQDYTKMLMKAMVRCDYVK